MIITVIREMVTWRAVLDIFLITVGLFFLYRTLLRLGTWKIVSGILLAMAVFLGAFFLDLKGIEWIYSNVSNVIVIALVVIFQPELRKIFERAASLRRTEIIRTEGDLPKLIGDVVFALARQKRGAILVLPGKEPVREWVSGGYSLNADPSFPLIMSIFDPNSPGHDGALIIRDGQLTRFGARLPVSQSSKLSEEFGTRHHAGMGLSEVSDAFVLVVSEERGIVTVFHQGQATQVRRPEEVAGRILSHWQNTAAYPFKISTWRRQWHVTSQVAASLLVAVIFWTALAIARGQVLERVFTVPVEYSGTPANLALVGDKSTEVKLHLAGNQTDLDSLNADMLRVKIDLARALPGSQTFAVTADNIKLPRGVHLLDATPSILPLILAAIIERELPIKPQLVGRLPGGLKLQSLEVIPQKVKAFLPVEEGQKDITITTTPIYLETIKDDTSLMCKIIAPTNVQPVDKRWPDVEVTIRVSAAKK